MQVESKVCIANVDTVHSTLSRMWWLSRLSQQHIGASIRFRTRQSVEFALRRWFFNDSVSWNTRQFLLGQSLEIQRDTWDLGPLAQHEFSFALSAPLLWVESPTDTLHCKVPPGAKRVPWVVGSSTFNRDNCSQDVGSMHCICCDVSKDTMAIDGQSELPKGVRHQDTKSGDESQSWSINYNQLRNHDVPCFARLHLMWGHRQRWSQAGERFLRSEVCGGMEFVWPQDMGCLRASWKLDRICMKLME